MVQELDVSGSKTIRVKLASSNPNQAVLVQALHYYIDSSKIIEPKARCDVDNS